MCLQGQFGQSWRGGTGQLFSGACRHVSFVVYGCIDFKTQPETLKNHRYLEYIGGKI